jgi:hypothetical protein
MATRDFYHNSKVVQSLAPASRTADVNGTGVDTAGFEGVTLEFNIGTAGVTLSSTDKIALKVEESDSSGSGYSAVAAADLLGEESAGVVKTLTDSAGTPGTYRVGYTGSKRYVRAVLDYSGTHGTGTPTGANVVLSHPRHAPVTQQYT